MIARLSLRQLAERTSLSNPYLSQLERGLHQPSVRVLRQLADALNVSAESLLTHAGLLRAQPTAEAPAAVPTVEEAIRADRGLDDQQKSALLAVYRSMARLGRSQPGVAVRTA